MLNDIYRVELAKFMHKLYHSALPEIYDNIFKIFLLLILTKPDSMTTKMI